MPAPAEWVIVNVNYSTTITSLDFACAMNWIMVSNAFLGECEEDVKSTVVWPLALGDGDFTAHLIDAVLHIYSSSYSLAICRASSAAKDEGRRLRFIRAPSAKRVLRCAIRFVIASLCDAKSAHSAQVNVRKYVDWQ